MVTPREASAAPSPDAEPELAALSREELVERARALRTVLRVAEVLATTSDLRELSERFVDAVVAHTRYPSVCLFRYDPTRRAFEWLAARGFDIGGYVGESAFLPAEGSLTGLAAARREITFSSDIARDERVEPQTRARLAGDGFVEGASVPVLHQGEVIGAFNLLYRAGARMTPAETMLMTALASAVGAAMAQRLAAEQRQRLEEQARRAQQLDSLGVLAGGIAHDFNNLLVGIIGNVDLARRAAAKAGQSDELELLDGALKAAERTRGLVRQLLTFARGGEPVKRQTADLAELVRETAQFASRGSNVQCAVEVEGELGILEVDAGQIAQVVQNLVLNAAQASPPGDTVTVRLTRRELGTPEPPLPAGPCLTMQVIDHGGGIPAEHLGRVFEPFFTLRPGGSGLGLAVTHSIVRRHSGTIAVASEPGRGTTFTIQLPVGRAVPARRSTSGAAPAGAGGGCILLMDDDDAVRAVARRMLADLGFEVIEARSGDEALHLAATASEAGRPVRAALLDGIIVGGLGGAGVADRLRRLQPGIRLVLSTGYSEDAVAPPGEGRWDGSLPKPYTASQLADVLDRALGGA